MWLINVATRNLECWVGDRIPYGKYAVLSHTWNTDSSQEMSFQEWKDEAKRKIWSNKLGYEKINKVIELAQKSQIAHVWVDTCCIDKTSSAELSEAINSMFAWYQRSAVCYVFLADVSVAKPVIFKGASSPEDFRLYDLEEFKSSRWFTRGWTLQELLAPKTLFFYDKNWEGLGNYKKEDEKPFQAEEPSRAGYSFEGEDAHMDEGPEDGDSTEAVETLVRDLSEATGIDTDYLETCGFSQASIAQRMSWAANRQTTRIEDQAYCLLGIFEINMPLLYGEETKAFARLQEEIMKVSVDDSLFAWKWDPEYQQKNLEISLLAPSPKAFGGMGHIEANIADESRYLADKEVKIETYGLSMVSTKTC